tara:strand:- start:61 stop:855 length:795 start_codon:yes stop_codon:yes gene_type:complete
MNIDLNTNDFKNALEKIMVKGKYITTKGYSSGNAGESVVLFVENIADNKLVLMNGDATLIVRYEIENIVLTNANSEPIVFVIKDALDFVKNFKEETMSITIENSQLQLTCGSKQVKLPTSLLNSNSGLDTIFGMKNNILNYQFVEELTEETPYPQFMKKSFESAFSINNSKFTECLKSCELIGSGLFKLDVNSEVSISSSTALKNYKESLDLIHKGESTIVFTGPLYSFFDKGQELNVYSKDEFPILIVAEDRLLIRAPRTDGD